jgi:hypothetical protein
MHLTNRIGRTPNEISENSSPAKEVDLFVGMESGQVEAVMILADSTKGVVKNKSDQPLPVKIRAVLAGVPILAQRRGAGGIVVRLHFGE